jgi:hypothetical protein
MTKLIVAIRTTAKAHTNINVILDGIAEGRAL